MDGERELATYSVIRSVKLSACICEADEGDRRGRRWEWQVVYARFRWELHAH